MINEASRPYLIIPLLVEQPTWGGTYIASYKNLKDPDLATKKIGQSYELYGKSVLSLASDTSDRQFLDDVVSYNKSHVLAPHSDSVELAGLLKKDGKKILGPAVKSQSMPLLLKFTQALGNSFQLHVKKSTSGWKPKPESWFYLEDGILTFGIKKDADLAQYKSVCLEIEAAMMRLSEQVENKQTTYAKAEADAQAIIKQKNPWQFVNLHRVKKGSIIDLSPGGLHHSWEEDAVRYPLGNIVFEIQLDVTDEESTIRSFDKGKMKKDGSVRTIQVDDYFANLDTNAEHNDLSVATRKRAGSQLVTTPYYSLDLLSLSGETEQTTGNSFVHLFVVEGAVEVECASHTVSVEKGYSCLIPHNTGVYSLNPAAPGTTILKSYVA